MQTVDDEPLETIHLYVVREEAKPPLLPVFLSVFALSILLVLCVLSPPQQPETRMTLRVPAVLLPLQTYTAEASIMPTGIKTYPATVARGILTITNGSVISQTLPAGLIFISNNGVSVATDTAVFVPAGSANGFGVATVQAHALISGKIGNISPYTIDRVIGTDIYIRNLTSFQGGKDLYTISLQLPRDRRTALEKARQALIRQSAGLHYPCKENHTASERKMVVSWQCQFVTYHIPAFYHVTRAVVAGKNLLLDVWFVVRPMRIETK